jgi:hypothetical protein
VYGLSICTVLSKRYTGYVMARNQAHKNTKKNKKARSCQKAKM